MASLDTMLGAFSRKIELHLDNEQEMAINRMVIITILFGAAIAFGHGDGRIGFEFVARIYLVYIASAVVIFAHIQIWPNTRAWRRVIAMSTDIVALTYVSYQVGPIVVGFLYPAYLLIIYGYGFRYGVRWLVASAAMSIAAVSFVVKMAPAWRDHEIMAGGLLVGLVIIPAYAMKLVKNLWQAKAKAEESSRTKSMFIAAVSHDLRTPLNAIIGLGDILAASTLSREDVDMARLIGDAGRSLLGQIDSILDFSRLEVGRAPDKPETVDLLDMLHNLRDLLDVSARTKNIKLRLQVEMPVPRHIATSPRCIRDSLINLVGNAIKFTPSGYVAVVVRVVGRGPDRSRIRFEVRDSGIGIGVAEQARIFDRFTQANEGIRETYGGSGLGLAISKQLVSSLDGEIGVTSSEGLGSVFWFEIDAQTAHIDEPAASGERSVALISDDRRLADLARSIGLSAKVEGVAASDTTCSSSTSPPSPTPTILDARAGRVGSAETMKQRIANRAGSAGTVIIVDSQSRIDLDGCAAGCYAIIAWPVDARTLSDAVRLVSNADRSGAGQPAIQGRAAENISILVAEDNKTNQKVIAKMLSLSGRKAVVVDDGAAALDVLAKERFDVVLMDINMPRLNGIETTRRLRTSERSLDRRTPVIALTADVTPETRARCIAAGIDDCITKPIDLPKLLRAIDRLLPDREEKRGGERRPAESGRSGADAAEPVESNAAEPSSAMEASAEINRAAIEDLERLGGPDFVREVAMQFVDDAALILKELALAVCSADVDKFRDEAHALRSCSANVGARSIYEICLSWRGISAQEFASDGAAHVARLEREVDKAREQLAPYLARSA